MFAPSPFVIATSPDEAELGMVFKIFYYHMPSAWMFLLSAIVCGIASVRFLFRGDVRRDRTAVAAAELTVLFGLITLVTGPLGARRSGGTWGIWEGGITAGVVSLVGWGCGQPREPGRLDDRVVLSDRAEVRGAGIGQARRWIGDLRHGQRAVHLHLGQLLADHTSGHQRGPHAAGRHELAAVVLRRQLHLAVCPAVQVACVSRRRAVARRHALSGTGRV